MKKINESKFTWEYVSVLKDLGARVPSQVARPFLSDPPGQGHQGGRSPLKHPKLAGRF